MTMFVTNNIKSRQHGAQMRCADWRAIRRDAGNVETIF